MTLEMMSNSSKRLFSAGSRQAPDPYDQFLEQKGFYRKHTARDSSCLFRVISEQLFDTQQNFTKIRDDCVAFMKSNRAMFEHDVKKDYDTYLDEMSMPRTFGSLVELKAIAHRYKKKVLLFSAFNTGNWFVSDERYEGCLNVFFTPEKHFDSIFPTDYIEDLAFTQGICFELLYKNVYGIPDVMYAVEQMLHDPDHVTMRFTCSKNNSEYESDKILVDDGREFILDRPENTNCILDNYELCHFHNKDFLNFTTRLEQETNECANDTDRLRVVRKIESLLPKKYMSCVRQLLDEGITPFPYKVAKGLDPDIYRNIEFDAWSENRKTRRYSNGHIGYRGYFQVGLKCHVQLRGSSTSLYNCHIQDMAPNEGPCVVFVEELGEKQVVQFNQLKISEKMPSWEVPYYNKNRRNFHYTNKIPRKRYPIDCYSKSNYMDHSRYFYNDYGGFNNNNKPRNQQYMNQFNNFRHFEVPPCDLIAMPFKQNNKGKFSNDKNNNNTTNSALKLEFGNTDSNQRQDDDADFQAQDFFTHCASPSSFGLSCENANLPFPYDPNIPPPSQFSSMPFPHTPVMSSNNAPFFYYSPCGPIYPPGPPTSGVGATTPGANIYSCGSNVAPIYSTVPYPPGNLGVYPTPLPPQPIPIKQKDLLNSPYPINYFGVGPSYSSHGADIPVHDLVTLRFFYNLGHEYFRFIHSNYGMQGVFGLTQTDTQIQASDSGIQANDSDLRNLSHELQQTLKIDNDSTNKNDSKTPLNNNMSYNNKRYNRNNYSGKKEHKNMHYRGHGGRYNHKGGNNGSGGGNAKKDQTSHVSSPSSQPQSHHNQAQQSPSQQQQQHQQHSHNDSGNAQSEYNSPNVSERFDMPPSIDFYQYSPPLMHNYAPTFIPYIPDGDPMYYVPPIMPPPLQSHQYGMTSYATTPMAPSSSIPPILSSSLTSNDSTNIPGGDNYTTLNEQLPYYPPYQTVYYQPAVRPQNSSYPYWYSSPYPTTFIPGPPQNAAQSAQIVPSSSSSSSGAYTNPPPPPNSTSNSQ